MCLGKVFRKLQKQGKLKKPIKRLPCFLKLSSRGQQKSEASGYTNSHYYKGMEADITTKGTSEQSAPQPQDPQQQSGKGLRMLFLATSFHVQEEQIIHSPPPQGRRREAKV